MDRDAKAGVDAGGRWTGIFPPFARQTAAGTMLVTRSTIRTHRP